ncbi:DUF4880 domain-containing protein [Alcaligenes nematophilus]|uniref:DUF4880 domain-containing protein n=1 Tax=Alcaligenes phenolicus TaxID=232846 RepID=A0ABV2BIB7_9BURK|nr:DUF4880 domain-containing protein [Alcaligenes nematophilus]MDH4866216.1 DUF4880 domain-containing protein [Bacillus cereus]MDY7127516.1 DUF4880 domain-containing protein [Alcaligenes nematophilus]
MQHIDEQALSWLLKQHDPKHQNDARSQSAFRAWLSIDPEHQAAFLRWKLEWEAMDGISEEHLSRLRANSPQAAGAAGSGTWRQRLLNSCLDAWSTNPALRFALGGAVCLLLGVAFLGSVGSYFL